MRKVYPLLSLLLLALAASACNSSERPDFIQTYAGEPYTGSVEVRVDLPDGESWRKYGEGSAHFVKQSDGQAQLVLFGAIDDEQGDAGFVVDGEYDENGWKSELGDIVLEIGPDGAISGGGTLHPQKFRLSGTASQSAIELVVAIELLEANPNALPAGTTFDFTYDLSRAVASDEDEDPTADKTGDEKECGKIRYEMRPVANIGDGTMSMIRVPICLD